MRELAQKTIMHRLSTPPIAVPHDTGASPGPSRIGLCEPNINDAERQTVFESLGSSKIAHGPPVEQFEATVAELHSRRYGVAVSSGTAALHLALLAAGVGPDDDVLLPTLTFVAPANAVCYVGAQPILFDAEAEYRQIDTERLEQWVSQECRAPVGGRRAVRRGTRRRVGAVLAVDLLGHPSDIEALRSIADSLQTPLILDAAQSLGANVRGQAIGAPADMMCLSFNANKIVTAAGGGMVLCDDGKTAEIVRRLSSQAKIGGKYYVHSEIGFNYRLGCAQAALGSAQLRRLDAFKIKKRQIAAHYERELHILPGIELPREAPWASSTYWLYTIHVDAEQFGLDASGLGEELDRRDIDSRPIFTPLHQAGVHAGREAHPCPVAERLGETGLTLPSSTKLEPAELLRVTEAIQSLYK